MLTAKNLAKAYDDKVILDHINLELEPGDRIGIIAPNGAGKSTLLDILTGKLAPDTGSVVWGDTVQLAYYDQRSIDLDDRLRLIEFIEKEASLIRSKDGERIEAAQMLEWFLFPRSVQYGRIGSLSGGERRRLYLLRTLIHQPNVLILDEPTNDLDIQTLAVLEEFLDYFQGCLIVVSHDRYFLDRTVDFLVSLDQGKLSGRYPTPYATFLRLRQEEQKSSNPSPTPLPRQQPAPAPKASTANRKLSWKEQREFATLEQTVAELEEAKAKVNTAINAGGSDYQQLQALGDELAALDAKLESILVRWYELAELAEG